LPYWGDTGRRPQLPLAHPPAVKRRSNGAILWEHAFVTYADALLLLYELADKPLQRDGTRGSSSRRVCRSASRQW
jgi:hypothetical protein